MVHFAKSLKKQETLGDEFGKCQVSSLGNDAGDEFGKSALEGRGSTSRVLGDEFGKFLGDEDGKWFSPGFSCLLR